MTVHHDKMAYGRLTSLKEDASLDKLGEMADKLNAPRSEREKMLSGELYNVADAELTQLRRRARKLFFSFNNTDEEETEKRDELLRALFGKCGKFVKCEPPVRFDYGCNTEVGDFFFANYNFTVLDCAPVKIGDQCFIGPNVTLATPVHPLLACDRNQRFDKDGNPVEYEYAKPITIEDNVWLASGVTVCGGVTIGHDTVIGAGSVVTRSIPAGVFAAGNPCRVIRPLTEKDKMRLPEE